MTESLHQILDDCFYSHRAEHLEESLAELFVRPPFLSRIETRQPCFVFGGRGSGKTTALRWLRFDASDGDRPFLGIYLKITKNQALAFQSVNNEERVRASFTHYLNLLVCDELCELWKWLSRETETRALPEFR